LEPQPVISSTHSMPARTPFSQWEHYEHLDRLRANGAGAGRDDWHRAVLDGEPLVRGAAAALLAESPQEADRASLERGLADPDPSVRAWAALGTARLGRVESKPELHQLAAQPLTFGDGSPLVAAVALARLGDGTAFPAVIAALARPESRTSAVRCLLDFARLSVDVWSPYAAALSDPEPTIRELALAQLEELRDRRATAILEQFVAAGPRDEGQQARARHLLSTLRE